ncbi:hypothetical protein D9756_010703 [Leucocoprinus leucothites]|uniref:Cytochrome P450 n=1 Tax=Leucocoprinus leucothites TaxID=201217 RepID=A0A8H5CTI7_9AGAR|nr:hypothetical protein D9756_010703 [Leucoagaricus leucothites]
MFSLSTKLTALTVDILRSSLLVYVVVKVIKWIWTSFFARSSLRRIPGPPSQSWIKGNLGQLFNPKGLDFHQDLVDTYGGMVKVHGFFGDEQLYISDPRALQTIIQKEQDAFEETSVFLETNKVVFGPGLVATKGEQHRRQRKITASIFGAAQLRQVVPTFYDIAEKLTQVLVRDIDGNRTKNIDMNEWMSRVALESVGRTVLGYSFDPLDSMVNNPYTSAIKELIPTMFRLSLVRQFAPFLVQLGPPWLRRKLVELLPHDAVQKLKEINQLTWREEMHEGRLKDIITALVKANEKASDHEKLSEIELTGQMTVLIFGAQDTTSAALSRVLWQLSIRRDVQQKVRQEIQELQNRRGIDRLSYDDLLGLPWLDAVIKETLRLYPPVPFVRRSATRDCVVPYMHEGELSQVSVPPGTIIFVGIAGANRSELVWGSTAREWKPERWVSDLGITGEERLPGIYSGMMSFLGGQRSCIGYRFALVEMKIILSMLLTKFKFNATKAEIVWNLSQIISPAVRKQEGKDAAEEKGLPLLVEEIHSCVN